MKNSIIKFKKIFVLVLLTTIVGLGNLQSQNASLFDFNWYVYSTKDNSISNQPWDIFESFSPELRYEIIFEQDKITVDGCCGGILEIEVNYVGASEVEILNISETQIVNCNSFEVTSFYQNLKGAFTSMLGETISYDIQQYTEDGLQFRHFDFIHPINGNFVHLYNTPNDHTIDCLYPFSIDNSPSHAWSLTNITYENEEYELPYGIATTSFDIHTGSFEIELCGSISGNMLFGWQWDAGGGPFVINCGILDKIDKSCENTNEIDLEYVETAKQLIFDFFTHNINDEMHWEVVSHFPPNPYHALYIFDTYGNHLLFHSNENYLDSSNFNAQIEIIIHPTPTQNILHLQTPAGVIPENITLYDVQGRQTAHYPNGTTQLDVSTLPAGVYFLALTVDGQRVVRKVVKE